MKLYGRQERRLTNWKQSSTSMAFRLQPHRRNGRYVPLTTGRPLARLNGSGALSPSASRRSLPCRSLPDACLVFSDHFSIFPSADVGIEVIEARVMLPPLCTGIMAALGMVFTCGQRLEIAGARQDPYKDKNVTRT